MISTLKSEQSVEGDNNLQAGRDINQYGISYADAKEIAMDIYRNELPYLTKLASDKAWERVEPVLNEILAQIHQKKPEAINEFAEPEVQYMLGSAMKTASSRLTRSCLAANIITCTSYSPILPRRTGLSR